jgi:hypothetical protein
VTDNLQTENEKTLEEFIQILGRIAELVGENTTSDDDDVDLVDAIQRLRLSGNTTDADELEELFQRAEDLKALHQTK